MLHACNFSQSNQRYKHLYYMCRMRFKNKTHTRQKKKSLKTTNETRKRKMSWLATQSNITGSHPKAWAKTFIYGTFWTSIMRLVHIEPSMFETKQQKDTTNIREKKKHANTRTYQIAYSHSLNSTIHNPYAHILPRVERLQPVVFLLFFFPLFFCYYLSPITLFTANLYLCAAGYL